MDARPKIGPFTIVDKIAVGGMGVVFLAEHSDGSAAAVKLLDVQDDWDEAPAKLFIQEVQATARLHHNNVVAILDYGSLPAGTSIEQFGPGTPYYIMEYVDGGSLEQRPPKTWADLLSVLEGTLRGLAHAHARGVIHRDIKPANILRGKDGRIVLTDFGIAHATFTQTSTLGDEVTASTHENASGTPLYMAPEQFLGAWRDYGPWTDLYALGIVAWHFACGRPPYAAKSFVELGLKHMTARLPPLDPTFDVPARFVAWLESMTSKEARDREQSAAAAFASLRGEALVMPDWRELAARHHSSSIRGVGLGLLGMRHVPTVGREAERDKLWSAVRGSAAGELQVVRIEGPVGTGTSHLARWAAHQAMECGAAIAFRVDSAAGPQGSGLSGLLHAVFRSSGLDGSPLYERVEAFSVEHQIDVDPRFAADLMSASGTIAPEQAFEPAARVLHSLAVREPLVLWFDDINESEDLPRFVAFLTESHPHLRATVVATSGNDAVAGERSAAPWARTANFAGSQLLELGFMSDQQLEGILRSQMDLPRRTLDQTLERCQGSPMFAVLLLEEWVRSGKLVPASAGFGFGLDFESSSVLAALPSDLDEIWRTRVNDFVHDLASVRLLTDQRTRVASSPDLVWKLLEAAAALGQEVVHSEWAALCERLGLRTLPFLPAELVRHRLARRLDTGFQFVHRLLRDSIVKHARSSGTWAEINLAAAEVLPAIYGRGDSRLPLRLAGHLNEGGKHLAAMQPARHAADRARDAFDVIGLREATRIWAASADAAKLGANDARRVDLWTMQAYALLLGAAAEDRSEAAQFMQRAQDGLAESDDPDTRLRVAARRAVAALYLGDLLERIADLNAALRLSGASRSTEFEARLALGRAFAAAGEPSLMHRCAQDAAALADNDGRRMQAGQVAARALLELGRLDEARCEIEASNTFAHAHNWVIAEARGYETRAFIADSSGDYAGAAEWHDKALRIFELVAPRTSYPDKEREYLARALLAADNPAAAASHLATVRSGIDSGKIGFYTHIEDAELACAAAAAQWASCESLVVAAVTFDKFAPYEIHLRALAIAYVHAELGGAADLATRIRSGLAALTDDERADEEIAAASRLC